VVWLLLADERVRPFAMNRFGLSALDAALARGHGDVIGLLLAAVRKPERSETAPRPLLPLQVEVPAGERARSSRRIRPLPPPLEDAVSAGSVGGDVRGDVYFDSSLLPQNPSPTGSASAHESFSLDGLLSLPPEALKPRKYDTTNSSVSDLSL
jgi:hypothetical protein